MRKHIKKMEDKELKPDSKITENSNAPELYSKLLIIIFSGLFSTIFGAVLLMYNMKKTGNLKQRIQILIFAILFPFITLNLAKLLDMNGIIVNLIFISSGIFLTEYFWNKYIGKEFKYRKKSWVKPTIISVLIITPLIIIALIYGQSQGFGR